MKLAMPIKAVEVTVKFTDAKELREKFLVERGWKQSCNFPDHQWRWVKRFNGESLTLTAAGAFSVERGIE